jgi:hydroxymethylpyrimidine pyrophosphatase-like HAD family hydrolase
VKEVIMNHKYEIHLTYTKVFSEWVEIIFKTNSLEKAINFFIKRLQTEPDDSLCIWDTEEKNIVYINKIYIMTQMTGNNYD